MSCSIGAFNACFHTRMGVYEHEMGIRKGGKLALLAAAGPMGLGALTYALHRDVRPSLVVVTDINAERLARAAQLFPVEEAAKDGIELHFVNTADMADPAAELRALTGGVITTLGEQGSVIDNGERGSVGIAAPKTVADPTGAGDFVPLRPAQRGPPGTALTCPLPPGSARRAPATASSIRARRSMCLPMRISPPAIAPRSTRNRA